MKTLNTFIFFSFIVSCQLKKSIPLTNDVIIVSHPANFEGKRIVVIDTNAVTRFSKEFWNYLLQSHPRIAMTIFAAHRYEEHYPYYDTGDSLYSYYEIGVHPGNLGRGLADSAGGIEKSGMTEGTVWKQDSFGHPLPYNPHRMNVSRLVASEFYEFKRILSYRDTLNHYVILYKNDFLRLD